MLLEKNCNLGKTPDRMKNIPLLTPKSKYDTVKPNYSAETE
jgi:hypothetical protein